MRLSKRGASSIHLAQVGDEGLATAVPGPDFGTCPSRNPITSASRLAALRRAPGPIGPAPALHGTRCSMLLSTGPRHELPADAAPQGSTDVFTSRLRDRVDALAVVLGQQAEVRAGRRGLKRHSILPRAQGLRHRLEGGAALFACVCTQPDTCRPRALPRSQLALIDLLAPGQPPAASNTGAASNLPSQLQPCVAHVAASVATAFRHSSLKLLLPELHR